MAEGLGQVISWYICTVAATLFLVLRLWVRIRRFKALGIDDGLLILSTCCLIGDLIIQQHMWNLGMAEISKATREEFIQIMQMIVPGSILYVTSLWAIKVALVIFYKRIAAPASRLQIVYNVAIGLLLASWATIFFHIIFQCYPHDKRWSMDPNYQCDPKDAEINYWLTILLNIGSDVATISLPISMVLKLQMKLKQKLGVAAIFALGFFVIIASIIRAFYSKKMETMVTCTVSMIETAVAIIAASLPALRTLFLGHTSTRGTTSNYRYGNYELSSAAIGTRRTHHSRLTTTVVGGTQIRDNDSDEELFKEAGRLSASGRGASVTPTSDNPGVISVSTTFQVHHGANEEGAMPKERLEQYP
ncbi:integral membrane protein PTH11 [Colletotrichum asianum]